MALEEGRCTALSKQKKQCKAKSMPGQWVCRYHGGRSPQAMQSAEERLKALQDDSIKALSYALQDGNPTLAVKTAQIVLDRTGLGPTQKTEISEGVPLRLERLKQADELEAKRRQKQ